MDKRILVLIMGLLILIVVLMSTCNRNSRKRGNLAYQKAYKECNTYASKFPDAWDGKTDVCSCLATVFAKDFEDRLSSSYIRTMESGELKMQGAKTIKDDKPRSKLIRCYVEEYGMSNREATNWITFFELIF